MKRVVLTGASGFIGSAVLKQLLSDGHEAVVLLRNESKPERIKKLTGYQVIYYNNLAQTELIEHLARLAPEAFIHLAWKGVGGSERDEKFQITENLPLVLQSVELAHAIGCQQWIGVGSQAEYGNQNVRIAEVASTLPTTLYGKSKLSACWSSLGLSKSLQLKGSWVRVFGTYGPGEETTWFFPYIISELRKGKTPNLTKCEQVWDYLYVEDAAQAILSILYTQAEGIFNIGSGKPVPLKDIVELIKREINPSLQINYGSVPYKQDQIMHLEADISKIQQVTNWQPKISLEEGIKRMIKV